MKITTRQIGIGKSIIELTVEGDNFTIQEDVSNYESKEKKYKVDETLIEGLITAARELSLFNGESDVDFVKKIADSFLTLGERQELIEELEGGEV